MKLIVKLLISTLAVIITAYLLPGVHVDGIVTAIVVAAVLAFMNAFLKPVLIILTIPITLVTLGLFLLVINALVILLTDYLVPGFHVDGFFWALLFSLILSLINSLLEKLVKDEDRKRRD